MDDNLSTACTIIVAAALQVICSRELQAHLNDLDQVYCGAGGDAHHGASAEVHIGVFMSAVEPVSDNLLFISICEEVYEVCRDDADKCGHKTLK